MCDFGTRLKKLREERSISQQNLANIIDVERAAISRYETQNRQPNFELLKKIADYFDVSTDYLLGRTDTKKHPEAEYNSLSLDNNQRLLLSIYNSLDDFSKGALLERVKIFRESLDSNK